MKRATEFPHVANAFLLEIKKCAHRIILKLAYIMHE